MISPRVGVGYGPAYTKRHCTGGLAPCTTIPPEAERPGTTREEEEGSVAEARVWVKCSICGRPIHHGGVYYACSVGSCNKRKHAFHFCSVDCWDAHRADANHRSAECVEEEVPKS
jgi:hypothetical protein